VSARTLVALPGEGYALITDDVRLEFRLLRRERYHLHGELRVECQWAGAQRFNGSTLIGCADLDLSSQSARNHCAKHYAQRARTKPEDFDWIGLIDEACVQVIDAERAGEASVRLADVAPVDDVEDEFTAYGFAAPRRDITALVSDGGKGKSTFSLYFAGELEQRGEKILLCDWETDKQVVRKRAAAMFGTIPAGLVYRRCAGPFLQELDEIRRTIVREGITYGILDSLVPACHDAAEDSATAATLLRAQRSLNIGWLDIAHVSKMAERGKEKPFGSQFFWNLARSVYVLESSVDGARVHIAVHHRKNNNGPLRPAVGFEFLYGPNKIDVKPLANVAEVAELAEGLPLWQRMRELLRRGPLSVTDLSQRLDAKPNTITIAADRKPDLFTALIGADGKLLRPIRIALVERHDMSRDIR